MAIGKMKIRNTGMFRNLVSVLYPGRELSPLSSIAFTNAAKKNIIHPWWGWAPAEQGIGRSISGQGCWMEIILTNVPGVAEEFNTQ